MVWYDFPMSSIIIISPSNERDWKTRRMAHIDDWYYECLPSIRLLQKRMMVAGWWYIAIGNIIDVTGAFLRRCVRSTIIRYFRSGRGCVVDRSFEAIENMLFSHKGFLCVLGSLIIGYNSPGSVKASMCSLLYHYWGWKTAALQKPILSLIDYFIYQVSYSRCQV